MRFLFLILLLLSATTASAAPTVSADSSFTEGWIRYTITFDGTTDDSQSIRIPGTCQMQMSHTGVGTVQLWQVPTPATAATSGAQLGDDYSVQPTTPLTFKAGTMYAKARASVASNGTVMTVQCSNVSVSSGGGVLGEGGYDDMIASNPSEGSIWILTDDDGTGDCGDHSGSSVLWCGYSVANDTWAALGIAGGTDNLGNHTATTDLNLATHDLVATSDVQLDPGGAGNVDVVSGDVDIAAGSVLLAAGETVDGRDVSVDGTELDSLAIYSATQYLADNPGSTTAGIQEAWDACVNFNNTGGVVRIDAGDHDITTSIEINGDYDAGGGEKGCHIVGAGAPIFNDTSNARIDGNGTAIIWDDTAEDPVWIDKVVDGGGDFGDWAIGDAVTWDAGASTGTIVNLNTTTLWLEVRKTAGSHPDATETITNTSDASTTVTTSGDTAAQRERGAVIAVRGMSGSILKDFGIEGDEDNDQGNVAKYGIYITGKDSANALFTLNRFENLALIDFDYESTNAKRRAGVGIMIDGNWPGDDDADGNTHDRGQTDQLDLDAIVIQHVKSCIEVWGAASLGIKVNGGRCRGFDNAAVMVADGHTAVNGLQIIQGDSGNRSDEPEGGEVVGGIISHPHMGASYLNVNDVYAENTFARIGFGTVGACSEDMSDTAQDPFEWDLCVDDAECSGTCEYADTGVDNPAAGNNMWTIVGSTISMDRQGQHDTGANAAQLADADANAPDSWVGLTLYNVTDASSCTIDSISSGVPQCSGGLTGTNCGVIEDCNWDVNDTWDVGPRHGFNFDMKGSLALLNVGIGGGGASNVGLTNEVDVLSGQTLRYLGPDTFFGGNYTATITDAGGLERFLMIDELASTANGEGASLIGIEDSAGDITATTVEGALAELAAGGVGGINNVVEDTTPQLGGNLDLNSNDITGTGGIPAANLTGTVAAARVGTDHIDVITEIASGLKSGLDTTLITGTATSGQCAQFDANGDIIGAGAACGSGGGLDNVVEDTTPQLGGNLDVNGNSITSATTLTLDAGTTGTDVVIVGDDWNVTAAGVATFTSVTTGASVTPQILLQDSTTSGEVAIEMSDATGPDGVMYLDVDVAGALTNFVEIDGVNSDIELGTPGTNYVDITTGGVMSFVGTGDIDLPAASVDIADINASGTPGSGNFLRGDGSWQTPAGGGTLTGDGTATYVPYYSATQVLDNEAAFSYNATTDTLTVGTVSGALSGNATTATTATTANAGDSATAFFSAGTIEHERGGLEADISAYDGLIDISAGVTSNVTNLAGLNTALGSSIADGAHTTDTNANTVCTGTTTYLDGEGGCDDISSVYMAQTQTFEECITLYAPNEFIADTDDIENIWRAPDALTITEVWCATDQTVSLDIQIDDGTPADVMGADLACGTGTADNTGLSGGMADGDRLDLLIASASGSPTELTICWEYDFD